jgi:hypothetical protein
VGGQDQVIDLAEVNRRYLKGGNPPFLASMQAFIEAGAKAVAVARKAEKYVAGKNSDEQKKLAAAGALVKLSQVKLLAPIPAPKKKLRHAGDQLQGTCRRGSPGARAGDQISRIPGVFHQAGDIGDRPSRKSCQT